MQLTFLQADKPLTKKYTRRSDGGYDSQSYPMLFKVTSHVTEVESLDEFETALKKYADLGYCLHTGNLDQPLINESRRGHHNRDELRRWIVLDLDGLTGFNGVEEIIQALPPEFHDVSYIIQHSPSSGIKPGLRAHVFFMLDRPEQMKDIKTWVIYINLVTEKLRDEITLTAKDFALSYPLDKIANDNGRVVYITPPECVGFADPVGKRIELVRKGQGNLRYSFTSAVVSDVKQLEKEHIDRLRDGKGLKKTRVAEYYETIGEYDVLKRSLTEAGRVHPVRQDSDLVMRCNLDDGDSEAYYYFTDRPQLLRNHKGEPFLHTDAIDAEYFNKVAMPAAKKRWESQRQAFVFRNLHDDRYYAGTRVGEEILVQPAPIGSEQKIEDWFSQYSPHVPVPSPIETWDMCFGPQRDHQWNAEDFVFNTWRKTEYMRNAMYRSSAPDIIQKIIRHVVGGGQTEYERFINWIAYVYQERNKTGTAWIFHGVQGTGKGLLVDHILTPIFGGDYVVKQQSRNLRAEFNGWMEKALIVNLDEFDLYHVGNEQENVMQALKMWITDRQLPVRAMYKESAQVRNFSNFIITTNSPNAMPVPEGERRFSFGLRQTEKLLISPDEVGSIKDELGHFAGFLHGFVVDKQLAHLALENDAKRQAQELSRNSIELFANAVAKGDIQYFLALAKEPSADMVHIGILKSQLLPKWVQDAKEGRPSRIAAEELFIAYIIAVGDRGKTTAKFKQAMRHKNQPPARIRQDDGARPEGWTIEWKLTDEDKVSLRAHLSPVGVVPNPHKEELQAPDGDVSIKS